jgi:hypothetical protein
MCGGSRHLWSSIISDIHCKLIEVIEKNQILHIRNIQSLYRYLKKECHKQDAEQRSLLM